MVRILDAIVIVFVAGEAVPGSSRKLTACMACFADQRLMNPGQREGRLVMVELGRAPGDVIVTEHAVLREITADMVRVIDPFIVIHVASDAIAWQIQLVFHVTVGAIYR
jgi:hypothetical protein